MGTRALLALLLLPATGCDHSSDAAGKAPARSEVVAATAAPSPSLPAPSASPHAPRPARKLCDAPPAASGRSLPGGGMAHLEASGAPALPNKMPSGGGRWTWVNLWAAWCNPCKEEIPRLKAWESKLAGAVQMVFLSLDDDERQAQKFLDSQPAAGLRATYWLSEDHGRAAWMEGLKLKSEPELPLQILLDPQGHVACVVQGAVEDGDLAEVQAIVARR